MSGKGESDERRRENAQKYKVTEDTRVILLRTACQAAMSCSNDLLCLRIFCFMALKAFALGALRFFWRSLSSKDLFKYCSNSTRHLM